MKRTFVLAVIMAMVLVCSMQTHAALQNLGTDTLGNRLIYDTDLDITWYDYTKSADNWQNQVNWANTLSVTFGSNTYTDWRLPITFNQSCAGYNCTNSEMSHLYYTELGNSAGGPLVNIGDFQNYQSVFYWSGTEHAEPNWAWYFDNYGLLNAYPEVSTYYALAVRPGLAVAPEPVSSILFVIGGASLGIRRFWKKRETA